MPCARFSIALLLAALALATADASAATYRCQGANGKVSYSDRPCEAGDQATAVLGGGSARVPARAASAVAAEAAVPYVRPAPVVVPPLPKGALPGPPRDAQGRPIAVPGAASSAPEQRKPGPLQVLAACSALVTRCVEPPGKSLDACFLSAPRCTSAQPWVDGSNTACCPQACWERYEAQRKAGKSATQAFDQALYGGDAGAGCVPMR